MDAIQDAEDRIAAAARELAALAEPTTQYMELRRTGLEEQIRTDTLLVAIELYNALTMALAAFRSPRLAGMLAEAFASDDPDQAVQDELAKLAAQIKSLSPAAEEPQVDPTLWERVKNWVSK